ncbi:MarR family transcriptional regulator [Alisedimentitalea sp. MJ-SS2]|uniref:MarR family winged helix-turn-helix transcriptional regulator n=1 Tax=Aliisedimentitalea sp. MJ-SS2 TaxID=3049795 RepID=UPI002914C4AB|nr:MarR family transcriptional regulator [Alisedimentitalea sp. MJ-SS2]MDU8929885.1 MarR family transcriptional regulator [Alisedimentitalea sp. MJ-SS2]
MAEKGYILDAQVGYLLRLASQRHAAIFQAHAVDGLTAQQFAALVRIGEVGQVSQNRLGRAAAMDVATIKGVVDRLRDKGLVNAEKDPEDKRRVLISLSPAGSALLEAMTAQGHRISRETLEPLTEEESATLLELLRRLT